MNARIKQSIDRIANEARSRFEQLLDGARNRTEQAAGRVADGKKPLNTLTGLGLKLSGVSYRTTDKLLKQHTRLLENQIDTLALRLTKAADAASLRDLVGTQIGLVPEQFGRLAGDARASLDIVIRSGGEARDILAATISDLRGKRKAPVRKKSPRKSPAKKKVAKSRTRKAKPATTRAPA